MIHKKGFLLFQIILFFLLAALMLGLLNQVFLPKWSDGYKSGTTARGFYELPKNSLDVLILGSSHVICGVDANRMYSEHGISAYSCGTEAQPILGSYAWLREALRFHELKAVVLDVADVFAQSDEASYRKSFDYMRLSSVKLEALSRYRDINPDMSFGSYLFPLITYHSRWNELSAEDFNGPSDLSLRGFYIRTEVRGSEFAGVDLSETSERAPIPEQNLAVFLDIIELCRAEGLELLLIESPSIDFDTQSHNAIQAIADEYGLRFLDFNVTDQWPAIDYPNHMADFKHFNVHGAAAATDYICQALAETCDLPDRRGDPQLEQLDLLYRFELDRSLLQSAPDTLSYLQSIDPERYAVLMVSDGDKYSAARGDIALALEELGLRSVLAGEEKRCFAAVCESGSTLGEQLSPDAVSLEGQLSDGSLYRITADEDAYSILINGREYATDLPGLNLVVWDLENSRAADCVAINLSLGTQPLSRPESSLGDYGSDYTYGKADTPVY